MTATPLHEFLDALTAEADEDEPFAVETALRHLVELGHARAVVALDASDRPFATASHPDRPWQLDSADFLDSLSTLNDWQSCAVPAGWESTGILRAAVHRMPAGIGSLLVVWDQEPTAAQVALLQPVCALLGERLARHQTELELADLHARVDNAQQLANMGDYDWHIASDTNRWSDQLFRIYGHEPQSFNASYERFLALIHPDDRDRIAAVHRRAYETGEPYEMVERIIRPNGELRYLSSNGEVVRDESGTPVRMRGTCVDITAQVLAEQSRERLAARFAGLVESSPDAILVLGADGTVLQANSGAHVLLGGDPVGANVAFFSPGLTVSGHDVATRTLDGRVAALDVTATPLHDLANDELAVYLRDASLRHADEARVSALREGEVRRRQAQEINDDVIQGLTAAVLALQMNSTATATRYIEQTLSAARRLMNDWAGGSQAGGVPPGSLVRTVASTLEPAGSEPTASVPAARPVLRTLVVDDNDDVRGLLCAQVDGLDGATVVGQASDGEEAISLAAALQPDLVLLDLSMPRMDGLQALPRIVELVRGVKVIVMSGFAEGSVAEQVLASGAAQYVEKGLRMNLAAVIDEVFTAA